MRNESKFIGVSGTLHKSKAEAKASYKLAQYGWVPCEQPFPQQFQDSEGMKFWACPDFFHPKTGFYAEFKTRKLNGVKNKARADDYVAKIDADIQQGFIRPKDKLFKLLDRAWNHSIQKIAAVSKQLPSTSPFVLIYEDEQDLNEERRCARNGIFMLTLANIGAFHMFLKLASFGSAVAFERNGFRFENCLTSR